MQFSVAPTISHLIQIGPILKPNKKPIEGHNAFRKLGLMSTWRKKIETAYDIVARKVWMPGDYQGGFKKKRSCIGRAFIICASIDWCRHNGYKLWMGLMIDYSCYFDTFNQAILLKKMKQIETPELLRRAVFRSKAEEVYQVRMKNAVGTKVKVAKGAAQGGGFSPWKGLAVADCIAAA